MTAPKQAHTPEPWRVEFIAASGGPEQHYQDMGSCYAIYTDSPQTGDRVEGRNDPDHIADVVPAADCEANARRIVACVNAYRGALVEEIESDGLIMSKLTAQLNTVEAERDALKALNAELVEALQQFLQAERAEMELQLSRGESVSSALGQAASQAHAVLAKVKPEDSRRNP